MIYTVTLNPSVDYMVELDQVLLGELNRTRKMILNFQAGRELMFLVLKRLNIDSTALGFVGGFTGEYIENYLHSLKISTDFVKVSEDTRINVKIKSQEETEINGKGPRVTEGDFEALKTKVQILTNEDTLILAGSIPTSMPRGTYEELVNICCEKGAQFVVDAKEGL